MVGVNRLKQLIKCERCKDHDGGVDQLGRDPAPDQANRTTEVLRSCARIARHDEEAREINDGKWRRQVRKQVENSGVSGLFLVRRVQVVVHRGLVCRPHNVLACRGASFDASPFTSSQMPRTISNRAIALSNQYGLTTFPKLGTIR